MMATRRRKQELDAPSDDALTACLRSILDQCNRVGARLGVPGEGGERRFRAWLATDFLDGMLGWPTEAVVIGERFDILLQDSDGFPVCTVETKAPGHIATAKEHEDFEARLHAYPTLRSAYLTNGSAWTRLTLAAPDGELAIHERAALDVATATVVDVAAFFAPLEALRYRGPAAARTTARHAVRADAPHVVEALAADLDEVVGELTPVLTERFSALRAGAAGEHAREVAVSLFGLWCEKSLIVPPRRAATLLVAVMRKPKVGLAEVTKALIDLGLTGADATGAAEALLLVKRRDRANATVLMGALWPAYQAVVRKLCIQTAHVFLARALLYRVGEDQDVFPRLLSGPALAYATDGDLTHAVARVRTPALFILADVRERMQNFLPAVYKMGEFDWWVVNDATSAALSSAERAWLRDADAALDLVAQRGFWRLDAYAFGRVDINVWRHVYQYYLPEDERQRLGGFYTPDELVQLLLDLCGYRADAEGLCKIALIDLACGSGAFVTAALARLLRHLEQPAPCHAYLDRRGMAAWTRTEAVLRTVERSVHAVDLHPFAAFLTTLNALFLIMPLYVRVREHSPDFTLDLNVFAIDTLEKHYSEMLAPDLFAKLNSRIQRTEDALHRYEAMLQRRFDCIVGNPPWGGVLKGKLAPVYDAAQKARFALEFPYAARGKYDVYGLFIERATQLLAPAGRLALLTQGSFIDKEWAAGLRELLATKTRLDAVIDLNPFGQLFFHAMNIPCVIVTEMLANATVEQTDADTTVDTLPVGECVGVLSSPPTDFADLEEGERRARVVATVREAVAAVGPGRAARATRGFAHSARVSLARLRETAADRWDLSGAEASTLPRDWLTAADVLEMRQGVTPGGLLDIFLLSNERGVELELKHALVQRAVKSKAIERWKVKWDGLVLLYPYRVEGGEAHPAFTIDRGLGLREDVAELVRRAGLTDALDFDRLLDAYERETVRRRGMTPAAAETLLHHRIALGLVRYPHTAAYLVQHYEQLKGRTFEKKRFTQLGKQWYEYHRPRSPRLMLSTRRILSPTLMQRVRFALDTHGYLSDHACLFLQPTVQTARGHAELRRQLAAALGRAVSARDVLRYCLAFLNSTYSQERLVSGHRPRPGEVYTITNSFLREIPLPPPPSGGRTERILRLVKQLHQIGDDDERAQAEVELGGIVNALIAV